jgi:TonB family protein
MSNFIEYLIKSSITLTLLYLTYWLLLRNGTHFKLNRTVLVFTILASLTLPFLNTNLWYLFRSTDLPSFSVLLKEITITGGNIESSNTHIAIDWLVLLFCIYLVGVGFSLFRLVYQGIYLHCLSRTAKEIHKNDKLSVVKIEANITPFAYFNKIFIPSSGSDSLTLNTILMHEKSHLDQYHFLDILLVQVLTILQWFNPFAWLFEKSLKEVHEYQADQAVLKQGQNQGTYQALLINQVMGGPVFSITNNFNNSLIKKRMIMMTKMKTPRLAQLKVLLFVPMLLILLVAFTNPKNSVVLNSSPVQKEPTKSKQIKTQEKQDVVLMADVMPEFPGGTEKLMEYLKTNIKYPEEAKTKGIKGRVFVQFIVSNTGKIKDTKIMRGVNKLLDDEAIRVIKAMPDWKPGLKDGKPVNVQMNIPVNFALK